MPRRIIDPEYVGPMSLSARCVNREHFPIPLDEVWTVMSDQLYFLHHAFSIKIHLFVLMPNHWHMMASFPELNMSRAMNYFVGETSRSIGHDAGRINQIYGSRYFKCEIRCHHYFLNAYKYFYRNPVTARLATKVEEYPYSTLAGLLGFRKMSIPLIDDETLFSDVEGTIHWLNTCPSEENNISIRTALKHSTFKLPRIKNSQVPHSLETLLL